MEETSITNQPNTNVTLEQGIAIYDPQEHRALAVHAGIDPGLFKRPAS